MLTLHNYFRSSTSTRLRAALNLKGVAYDYKAYALLKKETQTPEFLSKSPAGLVPVLELEDGTSLSQSLAIIEYIEETPPKPPLLPADPAGRARVRALSYMIACEVHPLNNLRVLQYLASELDADDQDRTAWFHHWVHATFTPLEKLLAESADTGIFCHGDVPGLADCCLYAQMWNNRRFKVNTSAYPTIERIFLELDKLEPFRLAAPPTQPDAA